MKTKKYTYIYIYIYTDLFVKINKMAAGRYAGGRYGRGRARPVFYVLRIKLDICLYYFIRHRASRDGVPLRSY